MLFAKECPVHTHTHTLEVYFQSCFAQAWQTQIGASLLLQHGLQKSQRNLENGSQKGGFSKRVVLADVPSERRPERGYIRMFFRNENGNEGMFACSTGMKT